MKNTKMCKVILIIIATLLLFSITFDSKAVDENDLPVLSQNNNTNGLVNLQPANNTSNNNTTNNANRNTNTNTNTNTNRNTNTNINTSNKTNTNSPSNSNINSIPYTGIEDHPGLFVVLAVCIASAIYAYRKTNSFNGIK